MTNEEALKILKQTREDEKASRVMGEFYDILTDALEKQIPKKVTNQEEYYFPPCPSCGRKSAFVGKNNYCEVCGQRLDWEENDGKIH